MHLNNTWIMLVSFEKNVSDRHKTDRDDSIEMLSDYLWF